MGKLYIIGNGFDLHYGLKTSTNDYRAFLRNESIYNETENADELLKEYGVYRSDFEEDLAYIDLNEIDGRQLSYPDYNPDHEYDRDGCIYNMEFYLRSLYGAIICFNYTNTDERVVNTLPITPVLYIHMSVCSGEDLIFGYNESMQNYNCNKYSDLENGDYYLEAQLKNISSFILY